MTMNRLLLPTLCAVVLAGCDGSQAQNPSPAAPSSNAKPADPAIAAIAPVSGASNGAPTTVGEGVAAAALTLKAPPELPVPVQEVVRLAQTTLGENVLVSYINNITEPFRLTADHVIYLNDLGISGPVVNALLAQEGTLRAAQPSVASTPPPAAAPTAPITPPPPTATVPAPAVPSAATYVDVPGGAPAQPPVVYGQPQPGPPAAAAPTAGPATGAAVINYNTFYESLSPYGSWVEVADYGYCWRPSVAIVDSNWHPYSHNGSWVWSDYGWYWNSGYSWGWAPFHYGRWHRSPRVGWVWQPGCDWGPAWVNWSYTGDHCAWAPLPPECRWSSHVGFSWWSGRTSVSVGFGLGSDCWIGVGWSDFCRPRVWERCVPRARVTEIVSHGHNSVVGNKNQVVNINGNNNTVIINNGAPYDKARGATRDEIRKVAIADVRPGGGVVRQPGASANQPVIAAYRPRLDGAATQPTAPPTTVLNRQREEERRTAATPGIVASRPNSNPTAAPSTGGRTEAPSRNPATSAPLTGAPARPAAASAASGFVAPTRTSTTPSASAPASPGVRTESPSNRPLTGSAPRPGETFANPRVPVTTSPAPAPARTESAKANSGSPAPSRTPAPTVTPPANTYNARPGAASRPTDVLQDNQRIQNPAVSPRIEERKPAPTYDYGTAPGAAARSGSTYSAPSAQGSSGPSLRPSYSGPAPSARPSYDSSSPRSAPSYSAPSPSYSPPSRNSAPAQSYSPPAHNSAPAPVYSAPAPSRSSAPAPAPASAPSRPSSGGNGRSGREN